MEPPSPYRIAVSNDSGRQLSAERVVAAVVTALREHGFPEGELSLHFCGDSEIRRLNREYRKIDAITDVLTFPASDFPFPETSLRPLGDVVINLDQTQRQAEARGYAPVDEAAYLALHGVLHLAGFDDESEPDRAEMMREMERLGQLTELPELGDWHTLSEATA